MMPRYSIMPAPAIESLATGRSSAARRPSRMASSLRPSAASIIPSTQRLGPWSGCSRTVNSASTRADAKAARAAAASPRARAARPSNQARGKLSPQPDPNPPGFMAANRAPAAIKPGGLGSGWGESFPRAWFEGLAARARGDAAAARAAFASARVEAEFTVREQPDHGPSLCVLGMIDAALGRKEDVIREGRRAAELLPVAKDSIAGAGIMEYLGIIYAWTGEKKLAIDQVSATLRIPSDLNYGKLRLHPFWDPLRGDPRFEKLVASLAPKSANK